MASVIPFSASNGTDVMFARSTDGGVTFSSPHRINDDPINQNKWHIFGTLSVAPNGRIDVVWLDTRNAANNIDCQLFYSWSTDGGVTWAPNIAVSNSFNPQAGFPNNQKIGDYITIVSDNTGGNVAYAATYNVNPNAVGGHEQDVYYVRVFPSGGPPQRQQLLRLLRRHLRLHPRLVLHPLLLLHLDQHRRPGACRRREVVLLPYRGRVPDSRVITDQR